MKLVCVAFEASGKESAFVTAQFEDAFVKLVRVLKKKLRYLPECGENCKWRGQERE